MPAPFNRPVRLNADGWETDTGLLHRAGWELHAEQRVERDSIALIAHDRRTGIVAYAEAQRWDYYRNHYALSMEDMPILRARLGHRDKVQVYRSALDNQRLRPMYSPGLSSTTTSSTSAWANPYAANPYADWGATGVSAFDFARVSGEMMYREEVRTLADLMHFKPMAQPVMVEADPSIDDLLAKIVAKQSETNDEYFREKMRAGKIVPATSAEIVQFTRVA